MCDRFAKSLAKVMPWPVRPLALPTCGPLWAAGRGWHDMSRVSRIGLRWAWRASGALLFVIGITIGARAVYVLLVHLLPAILIGFMLAAIVAVLFLRR